MVEQNYKEKELDEAATTEDFSVVQTEGRVTDFDREVQRIKEARNVHE